MLRIAVRAVPERDDKPDQKTAEVRFGCSKNTNPYAIGVAVAGHVAGPRRTVLDKLIGKRQGDWEEGQTNPGILRADADAPILFCNGGDKMDGWRVGWAVRNRELARVVDRRAEPLIVPADLPEIAGTMGGSAHHIPPRPLVVPRLARFVAAWCIISTQANVVDAHGAAQDPPVIDARLAAAF